MRVAVVGATGNVGTSLVRRLSDSGMEVLGIARRVPALDVPGVRWAAANVEFAELEGLLRGCDAVVHLAWRIQPSRDLRSLWRTNVVGSERVFRAAARAGVGTLAYASSVGVYSAGPKDRLVGEQWPREGIPTSFYARHKAEVERRLDRLEAETSLRVVRLRPALTFKRSAAEGIRRLFLGPLFPSPLARRALVGAVPDVPGLRFQAVHSDDVAEAYRQALLGDVRGPINVAAGPVLDPPALAELFGARLVPLPAAAVRWLAAASWRLRLQPTPPGWVDLALGVPLMDSARARDELGWAPARTATEALVELFEGLRERADDATPPLSRGTSGSLRASELRAGLGSAEGP